MTIEITSLGSGSKGNATLVRAGSTQLLVDSGFSCKELELRLSSRGVKAQDVSAVLVTHEHSDHFKGIASFSNKFDIPCYLTRGTSLHHLAEKIRHLNIINSHQSFQIGEIDVQPVLVPHDAREACQYVLSASGVKVGILTDLGHITPYIENHYAELDALLIEFNHDLERLLAGPYPQKLKMRVSGGLGHLNNHQAASFLTPARTSRLQYLAAMHLSEENNCPIKVKSLIESLNLPASTTTIIAEQSFGFDWIKVKNNQS